jgi:hypothetical protein
MRKLCTDEIGGVKMKKNEKNTCFVIPKNVFSFLLFLGWSFGFALQRRHSCNILNHSKWRRVEKDLPK